MTLTYKLHLPGSAETISLDYSGWDCMKAAIEHAEKYLREKYPGVRYELTGGKLPAEMEGV